MVEFSEGFYQLVLLLELFIIAVKWKQAASGDFDIATLAWASQRAVAQAACQSTKVAECDGMLGSNC